MITELEEEQEVYHGKIIRVVHQKVLLPNGRTIIFEQAERSPGVRVLVFVGEYILMTKEWRKEINGWDYRLPGGKVFDALDDYIKFKKGEENLLNLARVSAKRELEEEANIALDLILFKHIYTSIAGATILWDLLYFTVDATEIIDMAKMSRINTLEGEVTHPEWLSKERVIDLCLAGEVKEDRTVSFLFKFINNSFE